MANMFAKVFSQIFDSTIAEDYKIRHIFMDLLVMADSDGVVDKTPQAISRIANVPLEHVLAGLEVLSQPDTLSRTKENDGRRIVLVDESRDWGWRIVNFQKYREIRDEEARRIANRSYKRDQRQRQRMSSSSSDNQQRQPKSSHTEEEVEAEERSKNRKAQRAAQIPDSFSPNEKHSQLATKLGLTLAEEFEAFKDHHQSKGSVFKDWNLALNTWLRNAKKFSRGSGNAKQDSITDFLKRRGTPGVSRPL